MEWIEHHSSGEETEWNLTGGRATALNEEGGGQYLEVILEKHPGEFYRWNFGTSEFDLLPNVSTMEDAQALVLMLRKMED